MIQIIEKAYTLQLTESERELLTYLHENIESIPYMSAQKISENSFVSSATMTRFCIKLGFSGFHDLKYQIKQQLLQAEGNANKSNIITLFNKTTEDVDVHSLEKILSLIKCDSSLYIHGSGLNYICAKYLHVNLTTADRPCILIGDRHVLYSLSESTKEGTLFIIFSGDSSYDRYKKLAEKIHHMKGTLILITTKKDSRLASYCDAVYCVKEDNFMFHDKEINPRIGMLTITQIIIEMYSSAYMLNNK